MRKKTDRGPEDYFKALPTRIRELRTKEKITQEELGKLIGTSKSNIGNYETGANVPPADAIVKLAKIFSVSTDYLLGVSDAATNDLTEREVCEYVGLEVETIRTLHNTKNDACTHQTLDFLVQDQDLLEKLVNHAWSRGCEITAKTKYRCIPFYNEGLLREDEKYTYADASRKISSLPEKFVSYCSKDPKAHENGCRQYLSFHADTHAVVNILLSESPTAEPMMYLFGEEEMNKRKETLNKYHVGSLREKSMMKASKAGYIYESSEYRLGDLCALTDSLSSIPHVPRQSKIEKISSLYWPNTEEELNKFVPVATDVLMDIIKRLQREKPDPQYNPEVEGLY